VPANLELSFAPLLVWLVFGEITSRPTYVFGERDTVKCHHLKPPSPACGTPIPEACCVQGDVLIDVSMISGVADERRRRTQNQQRFPTQTRHPKLGVRMVIREDGASGCGRSDEWRHRELYILAY
jgi:hypothetical protein